MRLPVMMDSFGRISSITMVNPESNYNLATTVMQVDNPRGGSGLKLPVP